MSTPAGMRQRSTPKAMLEEYQHLSFRERFSKFYKENPPDFTVKKDVANRYGVIYFIIMLFGQYYLVGWQVMSHLVTDFWQLVYWRLFLTLILIQSFYNWMQCCRKYVNKAERRVEDRDKNESVGWRLCAVCQYYAPPRSHHCKLCKACILRSDHHCFFAAGCIGHFTTAYFFFLCIWLCISQFTASYWIVNYALVEFKDGWAYVPPTAFWYSLTGSQPWFNFLLVFLMVCIVINIFGSVFYLVMTAMAATGNMTFHEGGRGVKRFKKSTRLASIRAAWGSYYWIRWLVPFYIAPEGDGYEWTVLRYIQ